MRFQRNIPEMSACPLQRHVTRRSIHGTDGDDKTNDTRHIRADHMIEALLLPIHHSAIICQMAYITSNQDFDLDNQNATITVKTKGGATNKRVTVGL